MTSTASFQSSNIKLNFLMNEVKLVCETTEAMCHRKQLRGAGSVPLNFLQLSEKFQVKEEVGEEVDAW